MDAQHGRTIPTARQLRLPGLSAIARGQDQAQFADRPAVLLINKEQAVDRQRRFRLHDFPGGSAIGTVQQNRPGFAGNPDVLFAEMNRVKIPAAEYVPWDLQVREGPGSSGCVAPG